MKRSAVLFFAVAVTAVLVTSLSLAQTTSQPPYMNPKLSTDERVKDLVGRMTLEEEVSQMQNQAVAIPRLAIANDAAAVFMR